MNTVKNIFYVLGLFLLSIYIITKSEFIVMPLIFGGMFAVLSQPVISRVNQFIRVYMISFILVWGSVATLFLGGIYLLSDQLLALFKTLDKRKFSVKKGKDLIEDQVDKLGLPRQDETEIVNDFVKTASNLLSDFIGFCISSSGGFLIFMGLSLIFCFFFSIYYKGIKRVLLHFFDGEDKPKIRAIFQQTPNIVRSYLTGQLMIMGILAILNTAALLIIGVEYAFVWGSVIGLLAIIPYVGTALGLFLPFTYSFMSTGTLEQPLYIFLAYIVIQQIEGNILTPKVVGDKVNINPFSALVMMLICGMIWGIAGMILAIPLAGIIKIALEQWDYTKPFAYLFSQQLSESKSEHVEVDKNNH